MKFTIRKIYFQYLILAVLTAGVFGALAFGNHQILKGQLVECWAEANPDGTCTGSHPNYNGYGCYAPENASCECGPSKDGQCGAVSCLCPVGVCCYTATSPAEGTEEAWCIENGGDRWIENGNMYSCSTDPSTGGGPGPGVSGPDPDACANMDCNDDNACTTDTCADGTCSHSAISCADDGNRCTSDACDPTDQCNYPRNSVCYCGDGIIDDPEECEGDGFGCESCMCGPNFILGDSGCECRVEMSFDGVDNCECDDPLKHISPSTGLCTSCGDTEHWDEIESACVPDKCHDCEEKCNIDNDIYNRGALDPDSISCRRDCADSYVGVGGDSCSALCSGGNSVNGAELCPDARTCCAGSSYCNDGNGDGLYSCVSSGSPGSPGSPGTTGGTGTTGGSGSGGSGSGDSGGTGTTGGSGSDDDDSADSPPQSSSTAASSVSSCLQNQYDANSPQELCNVCDPACSLSCMCGLGYPNTLDVNDPGSVAQWQFDSNFCANECDEDAPDTPTFPPNPAPPASSAQSSAVSSAASSQCAEGETYCAQQMNIACYCPDLITYHTCTEGSCFECPACDPSQSSVSSGNSSSVYSVDICSIQRLQEKACGSLQDYADKYGAGPVKVSDNCVGTEEVCSECRFASDQLGCLRICVSVMCDENGFGFNANSESCTGGSCPESLACERDSDCLQPVCAGCRYDEERDQCNIQCNSMVCRNDKCVASIEPVIACDDCDSCKADDTPSCDSGESAYCCPDSSWKCLSDSIPPDMADEFLCNPIPDDDDDSSGSTGSFSSETQISRLSVTSIASVSSSNSEFISSDQTTSSEAFVSSVPDEQQSSSASSIASVDASSSSSSLSSLSPTFTSSAPGEEDVSSSQNFVSDQSSVSTIIAAESSAMSLILTLEDSSSVSSENAADSSVNNNTQNACGDGFLQQGEECDDGNTSNDDACSDVCTHKSPSPFCGNGVVNSGEECDDGNFLAGDGCTPFCTVITNDDNGDGDNDDGVSNNASDEDDDGDGDNDDGVRNNQFDDDNGDGDNDDGTPGNQQELIRLLAVEKNTLVAAASICGNGVLENAEECDDSNRRDEDGCSSTCLLEIGICGDGVVQALLGEQCEGSDACANCRFVSLSCGDGKVDTKEECDDGPLNSTSSDAHCRPDCSMSRCGDGILDSQELCDDGNRRNSDGCDRYCRVEDSDTPGVTVIASDTTVQFPQYPGQVAADAQQQQYPYQFNQQPVGSPQYSQFPQYPNYQQLPYQLPLAQLQPLISPQGVAGETGPAAVAVVASGMAAGLGWARRRRRR